MDMVEKVAKAIGDSVYAHVDPVETPHTWARSMTFARAAIEAMREPSGDMQDAGASVAQSQSPLVLLAAYRAMIDAALGNSPASD